MKLKGGCTGLGLGLCSTANYIDNILVHFTTILLIKSQA